ncbi:MAG: 50S ribosomal protein L31 [Patescibacteria group bacterium]
MQKELHPVYHDEAQVTCACGAKYKVGSTLEKISVEICAACHPFFTGQEKVMDTAGRVEKFKTRRAKASTVPTKNKQTKKLEKKAKKENSKEESEVASKEA